MANIKGSRRNDILNGTGGNDYLEGLGGDDILNGGAGVDGLSGGDGDDMLVGGDGRDTLFGEDGDDILVADAADYQLAGGDGTDQLVWDRRADATAIAFRVADNLRADVAVGASRISQIEQIAFRLGAGNDQVEGGELDDMIAGGAGADQLVGHGGDDRIEGEDGNDRIDGGRGADRLDGGAGDDEVTGGFGDEEIRGGSGNDLGLLGFDRADERIAFSVAANLARTVDVAGTAISGFERIAMAAEAYDDEIAGGELADVIYGLGGNDELAGRGGDDRLEGDLGRDLLDGGAGDDLLLGGADADRLIGGAGRDSLYGDAGDDIVEGGSGDRVIQGGVGTDRAVLDFTAETANLGFDLLLDHGVAGTEISGFESVEFRAGSGNDRLLGGQRDDVLSGGAGDDELTGRGGRDAYDGGAGIDRAWIDRSAATRDINISLADANDRQTLDDGTTIVRVEGVVLATGRGNDRITGGIARDEIRSYAGNDRLDGGAGDDLLDGGAGNDVLTGGAGADVMLGGDGDDIFYGGSGDLQIFGDFGIDRAVLDFSAEPMAVSFALNAGAARIGVTELRGIDSLDVTTGSGDDSMSAGALNDVLRGGAGNDRLFGRDGDDQLLGGSGDDLLEGGAGDDRLDGGAGDDKLVAGDGADEIDGGAGIDEFVLDRSAATRDIVFSLADPRRTQRLDDGTSVDNVERATLSAGSGDDLLVGGAYFDWFKGGAGDDRIYGGGGDDIVEAQDGNDRVDGGAGRDYLYAHGGNDLIVGDAGDLVIDGGAGVDRAELDGSSQSLGMTFEVAQNLTSFSMFGSARVSNVEQVDLRGGRGADQFGGGTMADTLDGGAGNDRLRGNGGDDRLIGGEGMDRAIYSGNRADYRVEQRQDGSLRITDLRPGGDGVDLVSGVEEFAFADLVASRDELINGLPPRAVDDQAAAVEDGPAVTINVLANDFDPEGAPLGLAALNISGTIGQVSFGPGGTVRYSPGSAFQSLGAGETATDSFGYSIRDASGKESFARVTVTITGTNDAPVAVADVHQLDAGGRLVIAPLSNDRDPDARDFLELGTIDASGIRGIVSPNNATSFVYETGDAFRHLRAGETAFETIRYTAIDNKGGATQSTVTITIRGANDAPDARDDSFAIDAGGAADGLAPLLLANDLDPDLGDGKTIVSVDVSALKGSLGFDAATQSLRYVADHADFATLPVGQSIVTSFAYTMRDAFNALSTATVQVTVRGTAPPAEGPVAGDDALAFSSLSGALDITVSLLGNDSAGVRIVEVGQPGDPFVALRLDGEGRLIIDPEFAFDHLAPGEMVTDSFTYVIENAAGQRSTATASYSVTGYGVPADAASVTFDVDEDEATANRFDDLLDAAMEALSEPLSHILIDAAGTLGTVEFDFAGGRLVYAADDPALDRQHPDFTQETSFRYTAVGVNGETRSGIVKVNVYGTHDAPVAADDAFSLQEGQDLGNLWDAILSNDRDVDAGDALEIKSVSGRAGSFVFNAQSRTLRYDSSQLDLDPGEVFVDTLTYRVVDGSGLTSTATVRFTVTGAGAFAAGSGEGSAGMADFAQADLPPVPEFAFI